MWKEETAAGNQSGFVYGGKSQMERGWSARLRERSKGAAIRVSCVTLRQREKERTRERERERERGTREVLVYLASLHTIPGRN